MWDKLKTKAVGFIWAIALKKGLKKVAQMIAAYIVTLPLAKYGVTVSIEEAALYAGLVGLSEVARNWLKQKGFDSL